MNGITIDGTNYDVKIVYPSLTRSFEIIQGINVGTNLLGGEISDVLGTKYAYTMQVEPNPSNPTAYDNFYQVISSPQASHTIVMPYGQSTLSFNAKIVSGSDVNNGRIANFERWSGLTITFIPINPQRVRA